ncbi:MAG: TetR/AcrR family transcriptional regulator [Clostridiales bacterium]|nr:TetR/AcrR family transcriptional regulator [Clostridiales bacterium]
MPKVSEEYLQEKRKEILDAAFEVCRRKPAYEVTMSDIVSETGLSQGGVYKYFNNIYSVYAALIDEANLAGGLIPEIDCIMVLDESPEAKLEKLFKAAENFFSEMLISYNKILFELSTYCIQNPDADKKINGQTKAVPVFPYLAKCASEIIISQTQTGYFKPVIPLPDILTFIVSSFDGIIRDVTLNKCYDISSDGMTELDEKKLISTLYLSTMKLLGK